MPIYRAREGESNLLNNRVRILTQYTARVRVRDQYFSQNSVKRPSKTAKVHFGTGYRSIAPGSPDPITSDHIRSGPHRLEGGPGFSRDGRHVSGWGPESGRAARAVRGRGGRLRAALWRLRDALSGSTGNGFVSGALLPLVASRAVCVGRIYSGLWRNYG